MILTTDFGIEDLSPYQVHSPREVISLLRGISDHKQLVRLLINGGSEAIVTSILHIDEASDSVILDCAQSGLANQRIIESDNLSFETVLDNIRILFFSTQAESCQFEDLPALRIAIPDSLIRLQRREHYRIPTPIANPLRCTIQIPHEANGITSKVVVPLQNVSGGGIAMIDEHHLLDNTVGRNYNDCQIDLPGGTLIVATLQIRNSQEITLPNGKTIRRLGCLFVALPQTMMTAVQRYITKLERERNARETGMR